MSNEQSAPAEWPTDDMVVRGAEELHDSLRMFGIDINFDTKTKGTEIQQEIVEAVFNAMLAAATSQPQSDAVPAEEVEGLEMGEVNHNNRAFDDLVAEMKRDYPSEMALAGEWAAGWADGVRRGAAQIDALRVENAELVAALIEAQKIINHQGWSTPEQPAYDAIDAALAKHRGE